MVKRGIAILTVVTALIGASSNSWADGHYSMKDHSNAHSKSTYVVVRGGATYAEDTDFQVLGLGVSNTYDNPGFMLSFAGGMDLSRYGMNGLRGELEFGYLSNDIDSHTVQTLGEFSGANAFGETEAYFGFASLYYDIMPGHRIKPFVGAGIGFAHVEFNGHGVGPVGVVLSDEDTAFAYHVTAGLTFAMSHSMDLEVGYRHIAITGAELSSVDGTQNDVNIDNDIVFAGTRIKF